MKPTRKVSRRSFLGAVTGRTAGGSPLPSAASDVDLGTPDGKPPAPGKEPATDQDG